ncbi:hypothetical protein D3C80_1416080 [compost metagenome]
MRHTVHRVVHTQRLRATRYRRAIERLLHLPPARLPRYTAVAHLLERRQCRLVYQLAHGRLLHRQTTRRVLRVCRVEGYAPAFRVFGQGVEQVLEMHQANTTVEVGLAIPGSQAAAHGLYICACALAPLQQVWQHQAGQVDLVVGHHALQVIHAQPCRALQALQGKAAAHAQRLVTAADQG